jgi:CHAD domain-containing protein
VVEPIRTELAWLGSSAGQARDLDVLQLYLEPELAELPVGDRRAARLLLTRLKRERRSASRRLRATLDDPLYHGLLDELEALVGRPPQAGELPSLEELAGREYKRLRKDYKALGKTPTDEALHAVRIRVKRARYAAELVAPVAGKGAAEVIARAKSLQDVIGEHQDAAVAEEWLRSTPQVTEPSGASLAAGMLVERQRARRRAARADVDKAWRKLDAAGRAAFS